MTEPLPGFPDDRTQVDLDRGAASIVLDQDLYPLEALYGAAYVFLDRCYLFLDRPDPARVRVTLTPREAGPEVEALRALAGEFANELLSCAWRQKVVAANRPVVEEVTRRALSAAMGPPTLDDLAKFDFTDEPFDDPLGIAVSWEEKYGSGETAEAEPEAETAAPKTSPEPESR